MRSGVRAPVLACAACFVALGILLVVAYAVSPFPKFDALALNGLETLGGPFADDVLYPLARTADPLPLAAFLIVLSAAGVAAGRRRQVATAVAAVIAANLTTQILKVVLAHPRFHPVLAQQIGAAAFPSGHATAAMSMALAAIIVATPRWRPTVALLGCAYVLALVVSILILGWHFPSDTLGGLLVAAGFAFGALAMSRAVTGRGELTPFRALATYAPPRTAWLVLAVCATVVVLARGGAVASFAHVHTSAGASVALLTAACVGLTFSASLLADR